MDIDTFEKHVSFIPVDSMSDYEYSILKPNTMGNRSFYLFVISRSRHSSGSYELAVTIGNSGSPARVLLVNDILSRADILSHALAIVNFTENQHKVESSYDNLTR